MQRVTRGVRGLLGELTEIVRVVGIGHELTEKPLVSGRSLPGRRSVGRRELAFEHLTHLRAGVTLERVLRVMGNVDDEFVGVAVALADAEHDATGHPPLHQAQIAKPHSLAAKLRVDLTVHHRQNHPVVGRLDVLFQQRPLRGGTQRGFLTGNELPMQGVVVLEKRFDPCLIKRTDVE